MKTSVNLRGKGAASHAGPDALDLYLKEIAWNMRTLIGQADVLETVILEWKKHMREYIATESKSATRQ